MITQANDLVEFASDAAFAVDTESRIVAWNEQAQKLLGYTASETIGKYCCDVLQATMPGGEPLCHPDCQVFQSFENCIPYSVPSCRLRHRSGKWVMASISSVAMSGRTRRMYADNILAIIFLRDEAIATSVPQPLTLQIFTLGGFGIVVGGHSVDVRKWKRKQAVTLLKYLVTQLDRPVHRERLIDCLWPDVGEKQGWGRLKVTMYCLRQELRAHGISDDAVKTIDNAYLLRRDSIWVDTQVFERLVNEGKMLQQQGQWNDALHRYNEARHLYRGDYLEEELYSDWCAEERERLHERYLETLARTAECHAELEQYADAIHICRKALVFDPCRENFHFVLMEYLVKNGRPDLALVQYRRCHQVLAQEFGTEPLAKTQHLYQQILDGEDSAQISG